DYLELYLLFLRGSSHPHTCPPKPAQTQTPAVAPLQLCSFAALQLCSSPALQGKKRKTGAEAPVLSSQQNAMKSLTTP
ncbi:hypothetical protein, partial [Stenotrophomonas sp. TWI587]|uniref:hypothetical protein n=1 Tax=Stenotrophomonas sp. TWI587 TaxID=3136783 RepID=UPI00320BAE57